MKQALTTLLAVFCAASISAQDMSKSHRRWLEKDVSAIVTREEAGLFRRLKTDADRELFQQIFWTRRDPDLSTPENEFRWELEKRIEIADERLRGNMGPGSLTDMGQLYLLLGFPMNTSRGRANVQAVDMSQRATETVAGSTTEAEPPPGPAAGSAPRYQTWTYPDGLEVQFRSQRGYGYRLVESESLDEILETRRQALVTNPLITYELDAAGNLLPPAIPAEPGRATGLLDSLMQTKATSDAMMFRVTPGFFRSREDSTYVPILFELDGHTLETTDGQVDVSFFGALEGPNGELLLRFEERAELSGGDDVRFEIPLQAPPGDYVFYLGVLDEKGGTSGTRIGSLQIPSFEDETATLSSVLLYDRAEQTTEASGIPGRAFQFARVKLEPIGSKAFRSSDALGIFFYVYGASGTDITARYVFYKDGIEKAQTRPQPLMAAEGVALATDEIPLGSFEPGSYRLLVQVEDQATGEVIETRTSFDIQK